MTHMSDSRDHPHVTLLTSPNPFSPLGVGFFIRPLVKLGEEIRACVILKETTAHKGEQHAQGHTESSKIGTGSQAPGYQPQALSATLYLRYRTTEQRIN